MRQLAVHQARAETPTHKIESQRVEMQRHHAEVNFLKNNQTYEGAIANRTIDEVRTLPPSIALF